MSLLGPLLGPLLIVNGVYALACGCSILDRCGGPLQRLHVDTLCLDGAQKRRLLAYWILTYGGVRLLAGLAVNNVTSAGVLASWTYAMESLAYWNESCIQPSLRARATAALSLVMAVMTFCCSPER